MYGGGVIEQEMVVPAINLSLIVNKDVDEDVVYRITKAINENIDAVHNIGPTFKAYDPASTWQSIGAPLHPGAEKYYREKGYLK